jgi:hypothetical protein
MCPLLMSLTHSCARCLAPCPCSGGGEEPQGGAGELRVPQLPRAQVRPQNPLSTHVHTRLTVRSRPLAHRVRVRHSLEGPGPAAHNTSGALLKPSHNVYLSGKLQ